MRWNASASTQREQPVLFYEEDAQLLLISRHRERLAKSFRFVIADATLVEDLLDKARFQDLARRHGLPVPPARQFHPVAVEPDDLDLAFPVVIKPLTRLERWNDVFGLRKALEVKDVDALRALWPQLLDAGIDLLAQQLIPGAETQIESYHCYVDQRGSIAGEFTGRKIRTFPLSYGHTTALEITAAADVQQQGRDIVERLGLTGVAKLDFKRDQAGTLHLLEINPRFTLWHHPAAVAGINIPALVYADLTGTPRPATTPAKAGVRWCRAWKDFPAARACRRAADDVVALGDSLRGKIGAVVERPDAGRALDALSPHGRTCRGRTCHGRSWRAKTCATARVEMERPVRLALISDIHANLEALEATFYDIADRSIDRIVCLGDIVGYNSDAAACIALIRGADCVCVAGNHDLAVCGRITTRKFSSAAARAVAWTRQQLSADDLDFLENLPLKANIGNRIIAVHGALHPRDRLRKRETRHRQAAPVRASRRF